jgi:hypothetical protein
MDYRMNYEPIFGMQRGPKLENKRKILIDICDRITHENPLANFFLMQVEAKLGNHDETVRRSNLTREYLDKSEYWQKRFFRLGLA